MDNDVVIFWCVLFYALFGLVMTLARARSGRRGWVIIYLAVLALACFGKWDHQMAYVYAAAGLWAVLVFAPGLIWRTYSQRILQQRYGEAFRLARLLSWLHPADGWREQHKVVKALDLAQRGETQAAMEILERFQGVRSQMGVAAITSAYRLTQRWEELLGWLSSHPHVTKTNPQIQYMLLRALGETGDLHGLFELYDHQKKRIQHLAPASSRDLCRLMVFAFGGRRDLTERLLAGGSLAALPEATRAFWLATADMAAGAEDSARRQLELLLPTADPPTRLAIERRLTRPLTPAATLDPSFALMIETTALEHGHDESFGGQRSLFSRQARATQILLALNILMYLLEIHFGGGDNPESLYRLGAMYPPDVRAGQWWRLIAPMFLHFGLLHLSMNMFALALLGPFVEYALGFWRFLVAYLLAGLGSTWIVFAFASGPNAEELFGGASGCIMGLVGAMGALMLRGWLREKAAMAKRRLMAVLMIMVTQTIFDSMVPQVSMTAHLSGALIGFVVALVQLWRE